jgi:hypothetical protein
MPQDTETPITSVATDKQVITGPDKKRYVFSKNISQDRINKYFTKKGIKAPVNNTSKGDSNFKSGMASGPTPQDALKSMQSIGTSTLEYGATGLPSAGGAAGAVVGGKRGAFLGGVIGEDLRQIIMRPILLGRGQQDLSVKESLMKMGEEGAKQAAFEYVGQKAGEVFFKVLNKVVPHATVNNGIPLLPSEMASGGKVMKYVEDLLSNLAPSAKTMSGFRDAQNKAIIKQTEKLANGFAKFKGTSEEMGILLRNTLRSEQDMAEANLNVVKKSLPAGHQSLKYLKLTQEYKDYIANFDYELMRSIVRTNKPELIAGMLRTSRASLGETRLLTDFVHELNPEILGKVQNTIIRDVLNETFTGSKDPTMKATLAATKSFSGSRFKSLLDGIGEEKLKALYGQKGYNSIVKMEDLLAHVDKTQGGGAGKFLNLLFILPFRSGVSVASAGKTAGLGFVMNRAAKIITSPEGVKLYENFIRASTAQSPRLVNLAREELQKYNERSDAEYEQEQKQAEIDYKKSLENKESK